jgi:hypothetical protein
MAFYSEIGEFFSHSLLSLLSIFSPFGRIGTNPLSAIAACAAISAISVPTRLCPSPFVRSPRRVGEATNDSSGRGVRLSRLTFNGLSDCQCQRLNTGNRKLVTSDYQLSTRNTPPPSLIRMLSASIHVGVEQINVVRLGIAGIDQHLAQEDTIAVRAEQQ